MKPKIFFDTENDVFSIVFKEDFVKSTKNLSALNFQFNADRKLIQINIEQASNVFAIETLENLRELIAINNQNLKKDIEISASIEQDIEYLFNSPTEDIYAFPDQGILNRSPSFLQVKNFLLLLRQNPEEQRIHEFLVENPQFVLNLACFGWDLPIAFFSKPKIGIFQPKIPDFLVVTYGQGCGCTLHFIEIEKSSHKIFNKNLSYNISLRKPLQQIKEWDRYLSINKQSYCGDLFKKLKILSTSSSAKLCATEFCLMDEKSLKLIWDDFQGYDRISIHYLIVIGRWHLLSSREKEELICENQKYESYGKIITYDQMIRTSCDRIHHLPP